MTAGTDRIDAEIQRVLKDRLRIAAAIEAKLSEAAKLRTTYAGTQTRLDLLLDERTMVAGVEARASMESDVAVLTTTPTPVQGDPNAAGAAPPTGCTCAIRPDLVCPVHPPCTCPRTTTGQRVVRAAGPPCPVHGHRPSHL